MPCSHGFMVAATDNESRRRESKLLGPVPEFEFGLRWFSPFSRLSFCRLEYVRSAARLGRLRGGAAGPALVCVVVFV